MQKSIPVVFFHDGSQEYLKYAIESAKKYNEKVVLLGNKSNKAFCDEWYNAEQFEMDQYHRFEKVYKHMSTNSYKFEITAFKKYFVLQKYLEMSGEHKCVLLDSDILTYINYSNIEQFKGYIASVSTPNDQQKYEWTSSGHTFYCEKKALDDFIEFFIDLYANKLDILQNKYNWHIENNLRGGICDMTLLYLWAKDRNDILNISSIYEIVFDHSIQTTSNYTKNQFKKDNILRIKKIKFLNGIPYMINLIDNKKVQAATLHFQGSSKAIMGEFYLEQSYLKKIIKRYVEYIKRILKIKNNVNKT